MTVAALPATVSYIEDGVTTVFPVPFRFRAASDLVVERIAGGNSIPLSLGIDYSVTGGDTDAGGTLTRTAAANGAVLRVTRCTARAQQMSYTTGDRFPAVSHEQALDRAMMIDQEQDNRVDELGGRAIVVPVGEAGTVLPPAATRAGGNKVLGPNPFTGAIEVLDGSLFKGDPGGNIMSVGLESALGNITIPVGTDLIQTSGRFVLGDGAWLWYRSPDQASAENEYRRRDKTGVFFNKLDQLVVPFGTPEGGTASGVVYGLDPRRARLFMSAWDFAPQNDTMNYFAGAVGYLGRQPRPEDNALYSLVGGRNCYALVGGYGGALGHDCLNVATAAFIGGAGSVVGNPTDIVGNLTTKSGYCSFGWMKNGEARGQTAAGFGELIRSNARGSFAITYQAYAEATATLGAIAAGPYTTVANGGDFDTNGPQFVLGGLATADGAGKMVVGSGVNIGSRLVNDIAGSLQIGARVLRGTVVFIAGAPGDSYSGKVYSRTGWRFMGDNGPTVNLEFGGIYGLLDNPASGGRTLQRFQTLKDGVITSVLDLRDDFLRPVSDNVVALGGPSNRFSTVYAATGAINTSDERTKQDIDEIPDEWLDAWGDVQWVRFRFKDAATAKGDDARWHAGLIAQRIEAAFAARGLDARALGLMCFDEWEELREPIMEERITETVEEYYEDSDILSPYGGYVQRRVTKRHELAEMVPTGETRVVREAGSLLGLRYEECLAMEAAWVRRELSRLAA